MKSRLAKICPLLPFALLLAAFPIFAESGKYRIDGKSYCKQIFDDKGNQISHFANWELIEKFFVSPDGTKMLVYHRPDKAKAFLITLYDLQDGTIVAEVEPGWYCRDVRWTKDYLIYIWGTSGGGTRFEYRDYETLEVVRVLNTRIFLEFPEENVLVEKPDFGDGKCTFYNYSDGTKIKTIDFKERLLRRLLASDEPKIKALEGTGKGFSIGGTYIVDVRKVGNRKYSFNLDYIFLIEGDEESEERSLTMEIEI